MTKSRLTRLIHEIRRRRVARVVVAYAAGAFALLQAADVAVGAELLPEGGLRLLFILALVGFPFAVVLGWMLDVTPEGIRITGPEGAPQRPVLARLRPWAVYGGGALLLAVALGAVVVLNITRPASAEVAPGADVIAVLPFNATGPGMEMLGEGMVDLLSRNLDEVGAIRTVDARTVLYHWQRRERTGDAVEEALAVGRAVRAGSVLTGSVVAGREQVRLSADLRDLDGKRLAEARVTGPADQVLTLVDSLTIDLLRTIWRSARPLPELDVAAITSSDLDAIRWFLRGERFYRASEWDSAMTAFANAVAEDGVFPLAHYRLAATAGWVRSSEGGGLGRGSAMLAARAAALLPAPERDVVMDRMRRRVQASGDEYATPVLMQVLVAGGRLAEGRALLDAAAARSKRDVSHLARAAVLSGLADKQYLGDDTGSTSPLVLAAADLAAAIDRDDAATIRRAGRALNDLAAADGGATAGALGRAAEGFARIAAADTAAGLREVEAALDGLRFPAGSIAEAFALRWLERLALYGATRERGLELLARPWEGDPAYEVLRHHALGRALAAAGRDADARAAYARFLAALAGADAELGIAWRIEQARAGTASAA